MNLSLFLSQTVMHPIWQSKQGHGSFVTFEMGNKSLRKRPDGTEYAKGDIRLWVYLCDWVIKKENADLCHSESTNDAIAEIMPLFIGNVLRDIVIVSPSQLNLYFSNGLLMTLSNNTRFYSKDDDFFSLSFRDTNTYLSYNQKDGFKVGDTNK